jgi:hypothetical protein
VVLDEPVFTRAVGTSGGDEPMTIAAIDRFVLPEAVIFAW